MAEKLDPNQIATFEELLVSNMIEIQAAVQLLIEKGIISEREFYSKLKEVQASMRARQGHKTNTFSDKDRL